MNFLQSVCKPGLEADAKSLKSGADWRVRTPDPLITNRGASLFSNDLFGNQAPHSPQLSATLPIAVNQIAALYVETDGCYFGQEGVDPWDLKRDARLYDGPHPVVAHPPCQRWGKFWAGQPLWIKRTGERKIKGDDGGCFVAALTAVRQWGGVIEHPEHSHAWEHFGLRKPPRGGGWVSADYLGGGRFGWTCCVEQGQYGHHARKPTWLYAVDTARPELAWGRTEIQLDPVIVERIGIDKAKRRGEVASKGGGTDSAPRIGTPEPFRDLLLSLARSVPDRLNTQVSV